MLTPRFLHGLVVGLALIALGMSGVVWWHRTTLRGERLAMANERAQWDTTRVRLEDGLRVAERLVLQQDVELQSTLRRERQKDRVLLQLRQAAETVQATVAGEVEADDGAPDALHLHAVYDGRDSLGVWVRTDVALTGSTPEVPHPMAYFRFTVHREVMDLTVAMSCRGDDAVAQVAGPRWARLGIVTAVQDADICHPARAWRPFALEVPSLPVVGGLVAVGWLLRAFLR